MGFRFRQNAQQKFTRNEILLPKFANQGGIGLDLTPLEQQILDDHFAERRALFRMNPDRRSLPCQFLKIKNRDAAKLLDAGGQPVGMG